MSRSEKAKKSSDSPNGKSANDQLQEMLNRDSKRGKLKIILVILILAAGAAGFFIWRKQQDMKQVASTSRYKTEVVKKGDLVSTVTASGTLEAVNTVEVGAEISARIEAIHVDFNDSVKKGQLLAELDREQYAAALGEAQAKVSVASASVQQARATLDESQKAAERAEAMSGGGLISQKELESAQASATRARASLDSAKANLSLAMASRDAARSRLDKTRVYSPIDGVVLSREVEIGQAVNAGMQTPVLFIIAEDLKKMLLSTQVDEADIGTVRQGQKATFTVDAYPEKQFQSVVTEVRNVATETQSVVSYETLLDVENTDLLLKPGMTATADITTKEYREVLLVPNAALRFSPPELAQQRHFGPPIPFIGRRGRGRGSDTKKQSEEKKDEARKNGKLSTIWTLQGNKPVPIMVKKIAMDGTLTAVEAQELKEGMEVLVDLISEDGEDK